ncbi:MAG: hypothetical protein QG614_258 [Patescibacteria group bacterium]|nr:hypothetical protein [Patescibacteria group bacterium]
MIYKLSFYTELFLRALKRVVYLEEKKLINEKGYGDFGLKNSLRLSLLLLGYHEAPLKEGGLGWYKNGESIPTPLEEELALFKLLGLGQCFPRGETIALFGCHLPSTIEEVGLSGEAARKLYNALVREGFYHEPSQTKVSKKPEQEPEQLSLLVD